MTRRFNILLICLMNIILAVLILLYMYDSSASLKERQYRAEMFQYFRHKGLHYIALSDSSGDADKYIVYRDSACMMADSMFFYMQK